MLNKEAILRKFEEIFSKRDFTEFKREISELSLKAKEKIKETINSRPPQGGKVEKKLVNIIVVDLENLLFNTLSSVINGWDIPLKTLNRILGTNDNSIIKTETKYEILGRTLIDKYAEQIVDLIMRLISQVGKNLKLVNNYGYISVVFFTAQERNKPFLEEIRKRLIKKLQELNKTTIVRFIYSANQKENDDYLFEGIIEQILYGDRAKLIPNAEKLPEGQKREYENFLKFTPVIVGITNDKRLKNRIRERYNGKNLYLLGTKLQNKNLLLI